MSKRLPKASLSLLLAATVLAAGIVPPAVEHGHEGGSDLSHRHDSRLTVHHEQSGQIAEGADVGHAHPRGHVATLTGTIIVERSTHLHVSCLGFRLTLPDSEAPDNHSHHHAPCHMAYVRAGRDLTSPSQSGYGINGALTLSFQPVLPDIAAISRDFRCSFHPVATSVLCDRARHERSGVLLT